MDNSIVQNKGNNIMSQAIHISTRSLIIAKVKDYQQLAKMRLTFTVVLSAVFGFLIAINGSMNWGSLIALISGGFLVVAASNGLNQIIEKDYDKLMVRTKNRPIAQGRMSVTEALIFCLIAGVSGVFILGNFLNELSAWLGFAALISYAFIYTPLKRVSPIAVFVGAFPGAIPPLLGWAAATGGINEIAIALFALQFFWQFPHFWAIAWILDEDYKRAGFRLLPSRSGADRKTAIYMIWYIFILIPLSALPYVLGATGPVSLILALLAGVWFLLEGIKLLKSCETKDAKRLMFISIIYNPLVFLMFLLDKV
jgi:heme o synthase